MARVEHLAEGVSIHLGDCRDILPTLGKIDAIVTDPPYGIAKVWKGGFNSKHGWGKAKGEAELRNDWDDEAPDCAILLEMAKEVIIWGGNYFDLPPSRGWLVWNKPERNFSLAEAELAWTNMDAVIRVFDAPRSDVGREHPTQKPLELMKWCVKKTKGMVICDPYLGSGTTGVAAVKLGRQFVGIEREQTYFDMACKRIEAELNAPDLFVVAPLKPAKQETFL